MLPGIGNGGSLARHAIDAALKRHAAKVKELEGREEATSAPAPEAGRSQFADVVQQSLGAIDQQAKSVESTHLDILQGKLDIHEAAARIQQTKLAFDFAMQVRERFVDAYREVMRMNV